jgi:hypothetical protein
VSIRTRGGRASASNRLVASMPSRLGMRMSISTTSGAAVLDELDGLSAVAGFGNDFEVALGVEYHAEAGADEPLVVGDDDADHAIDSEVSGNRARMTKP